MTRSTLIVGDSDLAAAYGLALRMTGAQDLAVDSVARAARHAPDGRPALFQAVRREARERRPSVAATPPVEKPASLAAVAATDWDVLERVALRGMSATEAAESLGMDRREVLLALQRGLAASRDALCDRQAGDEPNPGRHDGLGGDGASGVRHDPLGDRQAQPAAASLNAR